MIYTNRYWHNDTKIDKDKDKDFSSISILDEYIKAQISTISTRARINNNKYEHNENDIEKDTDDKYRSNR